MGAVTPQSGAMETIDSSRGRRSPSRECAIVAQQPSQEDPIAPRNARAAAALKAPAGQDDEFLKLGNQLCFPLYAASRLVVQAYGPLLEQLGLTYPQYLVLLILWERDGATVREIGEQLYLDSGTLTPVLKRLGQAGLVKRVRSATDERNVENWLTRPGKALKSRAARVPQELFCNLGMPGGEFEELRGALVALLGRLVRMNATPSTARI
jgi:DNA-binding MarR family transcriptional regulator